MNKIVVALGCILLVASAFKQPLSCNQRDSAAIINNRVKARIDDTLKRFIDEGKLAGISALIFEKGKETYYNAFGNADREASIRMKRNTIVRIYSMTKPVTGIALMTLYEKGAFQLDDPVSKYAPEFTKMQVYNGVDAAGKMILEPAKRPITIRDITRHTAGFATGTDLPVLRDLVRAADPMNPNNTLSQMAKKLAALPLLFSSGEQWAYGPSVDVQAYLVELLSGKPFDQYVAETIFKPLGMDNTRYVVPQGDRDRFAALYRRNDKGALDRMPDSLDRFNSKDWPLKPGGFGLTSTLDDYMTFARMLLNKGSLGNATIVKPETIKLMSTNQLSDTITQRMWLPSKGQVGFGIDFAVRLRPPASGTENNGAVGEFFWDGAASTLFWIDPENDLAAVLFTQVMPFYGMVHKSFRDAIYGQYKTEQQAK